MRCARQQIARKEKPRYDGTLPRPHRAARRASTPVVRFQQSRSTARWSSRTSCTAAVTFQNAELDDLIIARSDGTPTYNFCVVVDDMDMGVTHVIRGDDHLNNTPRQMNMLLALGATPPVYAHVPMILGPGRREALQAPRRGERAAVRGGGLPARRAAQLSGAPRLVARRPGGLHARGDDRGLRHPRRQQGRLGVQSREAAVAEPAAHDAGARRRRWCRTCARSCAASGCDSDDQALLEGVIVAQRERAKTLKEMAQNSRFFFSDAVEIDPKAAAKHLDRRRRSALLAKVRERLGALPRVERRGASTRRSMSWRPQLQTRPRQDRAAAARGGHRHGRVAADRCHAGAAWAGER